MKIRSILALNTLFFALTSSAFAWPQAKLIRDSVLTLQPRAIDIDTQIDGAWAQTRVTTLYADTHKGQMDVDFVYAAPQQSVVTGFAYWLGKEKVVARTVEREQARQIYLAAKNSGQPINPALVEMNGKNLFRARLRLSKSKQDLRVEIKLATPLDREKNGRVWTYPLRSETRGAKLDWFRARVHLKNAGSFHDNMGAQSSNGELLLRKYNFKPQIDLRVAMTLSTTTQSASLCTEHSRDGRGTFTNDGFFALAVKNPQNPLGNAQIEGIKTSELFFERPAVGETRIFGRYSGSGRAVISWGGSKTAVQFPRAPLDEQSEILSLARPLWGARLIEQLSSAPQNKERTVLLSKRFDLPSRWMSWWAMPAEERKKFAAQLHPTNGQSNDTIQNPTLNLT